MSTPEEARRLAIHRIRAIEDATGSIVMGISAIVAPGWVASAGQPAFQSMAVGVEKLAKMTLGMMQEADGQPFPSDKDMRVYGHGIQGILNTLDEDIYERAARSGKKYVLDLKKALDADPYWGDLREVLHLASSAREGRYVHERALGGAVQSGKLPSDVWERLDSRALAKLNLWTAAGGSENRQALTQVRHEVLTSVVRWWQLILRTWQHELAGPIGKEFSSEIDLEWRHLPDELARFARAL